MIGYTDGSHASRRGCGLAALWVGCIALAGNVACTELDDGNDDYCDANPGVGTCGLPDPWGCLGETPEMLPPPDPNKIVGFFLPVVEWGSKLPLAGRNLQASLCLNANYSCTPPITTPYMVQNGVLGTAQVPAGIAGVPVVEGFDGFVKFEVLSGPNTALEDQYIPDLYFLGGTVIGDTRGAPLLMIQRRQIQTIITQSFREVDPVAAQALSVLALSVYDCNGLPANDVRVEIQVQGQAPMGVVPFQLPASRVPIARPATEPLYTPTSGGAGFLNVPPGAVQAAAFRRDGQPIGTIEIGAVAGQISVGSIRPAYFLDANISGAPAVTD